MVFPLVAICVAPSGAVRKLIEFGGIRAVATSFPAPSVKRQKPSPDVAQTRSVPPAGVLGIAISVDVTETAIPLGLNALTPPPTLPYQPCDPAVLR